MPRRRVEPADAPVEAARVRIVDFGADFLRGGDGQPRHHFHCHRYTLVEDEETSLWRPNDRPVQLDLTIDVDGDGKTDDDVVGYHEFSLDRPFNPVAPWYDTLAGTPRWYGGQTIYQANRRDTGFSEDGVNQDHDGPFCWPRENWAVFHETYEIYSPYRLAVNWLWLSGGRGRRGLHRQRGWADVRAGRQKRRAEVGQTVLPTTAVRFTGHGLQRGVHRRGCEGRSRDGRNDRRTRRGAGAAVRGTSGPSTGIPCSRPTR